MNAGTIVDLSTFRPLSTIHSGTSLSISMSLKIMFLFGASNAMSIGRLGIKLR